VALAHRAGLGIDLALINELQVVPDFRPPETIRLGIAPLYTSYQELHTAVMRLRQVVEERRYEKYGGTVPVVT
jgi:kynureninase